MYNIISIDPGTNHLGLCCTTVDDEFNILGIDSTTYHLNYLDNIELDSYYCTSNKRFFKIQKQREILNNVLIQTNPIALAYEGPFINYKRPQAYGALMEVVYNLKQTTNTFSPDIPITEYPPSFIKKYVGSHHVGNKKDMKSAIQRIKEVMSKLKYSIDHYDEHAIDGVACGYVHIQKLRGKL